MRSISNVAWRDINRVTRHIQFLLSEMPNPDHQGAALILVMGTWLAGDSITKDRFIEEMVPVMYDICENKRSPFAQPRKRKKK